MATIFKYNNQFICASKLEKKLKKMRISLNDIEILLENIPENNLSRIFNMLQENPNIDLNYLDSIKNNVFEKPKDEYYIIQKFVWFKNLKNNCIYSEGEYIPSIDYIKRLYTLYDNPEDYEIRIYNGAIYRDADYEILNKN